MNKRNVTLNELITSLQKADHVLLNKEIHSIGSTSDGYYVIHLDDNKVVRVPMYK